MINCPNCGAPAQGHFCEYCDTPLFTSVEAVQAAQGRRCHVWFENPDGTIECFDMWLDRVTQVNDTETFYTDTIPYISVTTARNIELEGRLLDFDRRDWDKVVGWQADRYSKRKEQEHG